MSSIKKNYFYNVLYQILLFITPFITAPYIARTIGAEGIGIYSYSYSIAYYFYIFGMLGVSNFGNRSIARVQNDREKRTTEFWNIYVIQFILGILLSLCFTGWVLTYVEVNQNIFLLQVFIPLSSIFDISWFFFGMEKFKLIIPRNIILKILNILLVLIIVKCPEDLWKYTLILSLIICGSHIALWPFLHRFIGKPSFDFVKIKENFKSDVVLFVPVLAISLYKVMDKIMLGSMSDAFQVGYYENAEKVINIPNGLITAFSTVMLPRMSAYFANGAEDSALNMIKKSTEFMMFLSCALAFGLYSIAEEFTVFFYGNDFLPTAALIKIMSLMIIAQALCTVMRSLYLIPKGKDSLYISSIFAGAGMNLVLNAFLIPRFYAEGAAIATLIAEFSVMVGQILSVRKNVQITKYIAKGLKYVVFGVVMVFILNYVTADTNLLIVIVKTFLGGFIYLVLSGFANRKIAVVTIHNYMEKFVRR